jgi:hypothetical protein
MIGELPAERAELQTGGTRRTCANLPHPHRGTLHQP